MPDATLPEWAPELERRLAEELRADVRVVGVAPLHGGACQDNFRLELVVDGAPRRLALRSDARTSLPGSIDREAERDVILAAVAAGVPTPAVRAWLPDLVRPGAGAYAMDWVDGVAIGAKVLRAPELEAARAALPGQLARALAAIHRVRPDHGVEPAPEREIRSQLETLDRLPERHPGLEVALRWLGAHRPADRPAVLVHGDFRTGNFQVGPEGLRAVLDWEFARWGSPAEDLGWLCVRDWRFGRLDREAGGLCTRAEFLAAYAEAGGEPVSEAEVRWWEIAGNVRWATGAHWQARRVLDGSSQDLELLAIGRRACEMEAEALRLVGEASRAG
jgi:aminoglycoside phosphotransferase (APT) family kinase protein